VAAADEPAKSPTAGSGGGPGFSFRGGSGQGTNVSRDILTSAGLGTIKSSSVTTVSKLKDVSAGIAAGPGIRHAEGDRLEQSPDHSPDHR
jgi:hypothetical protein